MSSISYQRANPIHPLGENGFYKLIGRNTSDDAGYMKLNYIIHPLIMKSWTPKHCSLISQVKIKYQTYVLDHSGKSPHTECSVGSSNCSTPFNINYANCSVGRSNPVSKEIMLNVQLAVQTCEQEQD